MKKTPIVLAVAITLGASSGVIAADKKNKETKDKQANTQPEAKPKAAAEPGTVKENTALTGSYIKRDVKRSGVVTDGPNPVYVLDHDSIQTSGASDLSQVLLRRGFRH